SARERPGAINMAAKKPTFVLYLRNTMISPQFFISGYRLRAPNQIRHFKLIYKKILILFFSVS
ncbi:MAG: hypothetical protein ABW098_14205, partial [Candidatus Thiodiazotropha sp.]